MIKMALTAALLLLSTAAPAGEPAHCRVIKLGTLPIEFTRLQPTLHGTFNGVDLRLLMDSGAATTILFPSAVRKANLQETHSDIIGVGVGGQSQTYIANADEVEIGPAHGEKVRFLESLEAKVPADGLLGADYLFRTDVELLLRDNQVTFTHPDGDCDDKPLAYWDRGASWVESRDMMGKQDMRQRIEVRINGERFTALLDSGAQQSVLDLRAASRIGLTPDSAGTERAGEFSGVGDKKVTAWRARVDSFEIGDEAIKNTQIQIADLYGAARSGGGPRLDIGAQPDMLLGADFMRAHHLLFARSQRRLYFTYLGGPVFSLAPSAADLAAEAARHREAAEKGLAADMLALAQMLALGRGVEKDPVEAYKWLLIAAEGSWAKEHPDFGKAVLRESATLRDEMSEPQMADAQSRAKAWEPPH